MRVLKHAHDALSDARVGDRRGSVLTR
jgi:hypothetical protein